MSQGLMKRQDFLKKLQQQQNSESTETSPETEKTTEPSVFGTNQSRIFHFLQEHKSEAYTQKELQDELQIKHPASVNLALQRLVNKGLVSCRIFQYMKYYGVDEKYAIAEEKEEVIEEEE